MILSFSVSNFRSFDKEATISAFASKRVQDEHEQHLVAIPGTDEKALPILVLYGANGAGKSNLIKALDYLRAVATSLNMAEARTGRVSFFGQEDQSTELDLIFLAEGVALRYGVILDSSSVIEEWLLKIEGSRESVIFERSTSANLQVQVKLGNAYASSERFKSLAVVGCRANQSFLSTAISTMNRADLPDGVRAAVEWLQQLSIVGPQSSIPNLAELFEKSAELRSFAIEVLRNFSTGIEGLDAVKIPLTRDQVAAVLPPERMYEAESMLAGRPEVSFIAGAPDGTLILVESIDPWSAHHYTLRTVHKRADGSTALLGLDDESDGTRRLMHLAPALFQLRSSPSVFVVDELDRSLHPNLIYSFVKAYLMRPQSNFSQLVVTTHESQLLDTELLRRDEVWFAEKDKRGATHLYSLSDFRVRKDLSIRKHYLQGRFGAVPFLKDAERLVPDLDSTH
jgi:AAA15 family ATPase/GTPase